MTPLAAPTPTSTLGPPPISTNHRSPLPGDLGDPVALLHDRGINDLNCLDLRAQANILKSFNNFKKNSSYNISLSYTIQLVVVTKLLDEAVSCLSPASGECPATQDDLRHTVDDIKCSLTTQTQQPYSHPFPQSSSILCQCC